MQKNCYLAQTFKFYDMILIADSGSSKTEWALIDKNGIVRTFRTSGLNPYFLSEEEIRHILKREVLVELPIECITEVYFYGAGCTGAHNTQNLCVQLHRVVGPDTVEVDSDLMGAARALCGEEQGIVCILGTGSNSGVYDGKTIISQVPSLGFILGDEGSGSDLGKNLLADALKGLLPDEIADAFFSRYHLSRDNVLEAIYRRPLPNRYIAQFSYFVKEHLDNDYVRALAKRRFEAFFRRNILGYPVAEMPVHFIGSVAYHYSELLQEVAAGLSINMGRILLSPMEGLARYHSERIAE